MSSHRQLPFRVVKLGGSLLDSDFDSDRESELYPHSKPLRSGESNFALPLRIRKWLSLQEPMKTLWVVGGGRMVDNLRNFPDPKHTPEELHWLAIERMNLNAHLMRSWFKDWPVVTEFSNGNFNYLSNGIPGLNENLQPALNFICPTKDWLRSNPDLLPKSWDVTSDSIAAALAAKIGARELVLLKSRDAGKSSIAQLSDTSYVDKHFPTAISKCESGLACRFVNFHNPSFPESCLFSRHSR